MAVVCNRIVFLGRIAELKQQRRTMESIAAYMNLY
jgi:hypothetical protein